MSILFKNAEIITGTEPDFVIRGGYVAVEGERITEVSRGLPSGSFDRVIDCKDKVLMPGLYNAHNHIPMTLLRGYAEELPLERWLNERIFPAEERLTGEYCYWAAQLSAAEMLASGTVSCTDMYYFSGDIARAVEQSGMKANIARSLSCFDEVDYDDEGRLDDALSVYRECNGIGGGRIKIDMSIHSVYTTNEGYVRRVGERLSDVDCIIQCHLSETKTEVDNCIAKYSRTPARVFYDAGLFKKPCSAAHCVWLSDEDMDILAENGVFAVHNPTSNLKLASGIADVPKMLQKGIRVAIGTDGCASNNNMNMFEEMHLAALLPKGIRLDPTAMPAKQVISMATAAGALSQGREDCGYIKAGARADIIMLDFDKPHLIPDHDPVFNVVYSAQGSDVAMTMVDGKILYENGQYRTIDMEKVKFNAQAAYHGMTGK